MRNSDKEIAAKRAFLYAAKIRFSPSGAGVRSQAIERIVQQNIASVESPTGLTEQQLQDLFVEGKAKIVLRASEVREGLRRLEQSSRIVKVQDGDELLYSLSNEARQEVLSLVAESEELLNAAVGELFGAAPGGAIQYHQPFVELLCLVFSRLGEVYVQVITMNLEAGKFAELNSLNTTINEVLEDQPVPDDQAFRYGLSRFFRESTPNFDKIKWNMAQNFYVAKALGITNEFDLLSSEIMKDASLYCDTNVLVAGLAPGTRHHNSFRELAKGCQVIGMQLKAVRATLEELKGVISSRSELLKRVFDRIPSDTQEKVQDFLLTSFLYERLQTPELSLEEFIERFQAPLEQLSASFGLIEEDDEWFDSASRDEDTKKLAGALSRIYFKMRSRTKSPNASLHDALLLKWIARENGNKRNSWLVTLDGTLAEESIGKQKDQFKVITLDALLQWMPPVLHGSTNQDRLAEIFSEAIRYQLLPRDTFFQLRDFQVFAEMGIETQQLPADDVEACISEIRQNVPQLNPGKAEDREKIGQVIQRYFADPGTKYNREIQNLQEQVGKLTEKLEAVLEQKSDADKRVDRAERQCSRSQLTLSIWKKTILTFLALLVLEAVITYLVSNFGKGGNLFQKITSSWVWFGAGFAGIALVYPFVLGRERLRLLKWWKGESDNESPSS